MAAAAECAADVEALRLSDVEGGWGWVGDFEAGGVVFEVVDVFVGEVGDADVDSVMVSIPALKLNM